MPYQKIASKKKKAVNRNRAAAHEQLIMDYFKPGATLEDLFRRRFCMSRKLFDRICAAVSQHDIYFGQKPDAAGRPGFLRSRK